ncbi:hypothetical protein PRIPAC_87464 [Pristionchus pacificus]|uniref:Thioredoxin n=1 Tax=Pristionchus pacificus TaxID=54126 RepID=A0A2A6B8R9_PRIPA|nr:hypothetical protein PRIPAC_87464 [Pristionchus pacificus]|eukprot:PDM62268.1 Thioredoxin [Pristionchus pacificus]
MRPGILCLSLTGIFVVTLLFLYFGGQKGPAIIAYVDELRQFRRSRYNYVIGYFENPDSAEARDFLEALAEGDVRDLPYAITSDPVLRAKLGIPEGPRGILLVNEDERAVYEGDAYTVSAIRKWIEATLWSLQVAAARNRAPLITDLHLDPKNIYSGAFKHYMFLVAPKSSPDFPAHLEAFTEAARRYRGRTRYVLVNTDLERGAEYAKRFPGYELEGGAAVYAMAHGEHGLEKFAHGLATLDSTHIINYNKNLLTGKLKRYYKSEEIPDDWDSKPVKELVGRNFNEVIANSGKPAFVFFYSPWSPYSKQIDPAWTELGDAFVDSDRIEGLHINSQPSFMFFPNGLNEPIEYSGGRSIEELVAFVKEQIENNKMTEEQHKFIPALMALLVLATLGISIGNLIVILEAYRIDFVQNYFTRRLYMRCHKATWENMPRAADRNAQLGITSLEKRREEIDLKTASNLLRGKYKISNQKPHHFCYYYTRNGINFTNNVSSSNYRQHSFFPRAARLVVKSGILNTSSSE